MRIRCLGLLAASCALLAGAARGDETPEAGRPFTMTASPSTLKVGARCRVEMRPVSRGGRQTTTIYEGVVTKASEQGVGLALSKQKQLIVRRTPLGHAPVLDRIFRGAGADRPALEAMTEVWLPSKTIGSIHMIDGGTRSISHLAPMSRSRR